jgi:hypothetical protein
MTAPAGKAARRAAGYTPPHRDNLRILLKRTVFLDCAFGRPMSPNLQHLSEKIAGKIKK